MRIFFQITLEKITHSQLKKINQSSTEIIATPWSLLTIIKINKMFDDSILVWFVNASSGNRNVTLKWKSLRHKTELFIFILIQNRNIFRPLAYSKPWYIQNPGIFRTLAYSEPWHWHIQNPGIFRTLTYSEPWYIQKLGIFRTLTYSEHWHIQNLGIFKTLAYS